MTSWVWSTPAAVWGGSNLKVLKIVFESQKDDYPFPGYPWWPGMVDYCPDVGETFILDQETNEASKYHVV